MDNMRAFARVATEADAGLPTFSHSKIDAIFTCPTWGVLRKLFPDEGRSMALDAGKAFHSAAAAIRFFDAAKHYGEWDEGELRKVLPSCSTDVLVRELQDGSSDARGRWALSVLHAEGFEDDPDDKRRTLANLEEAVVLYNLRWDAPGPGRFPVYRDRERGLLGIEVPFDLVITYADVAPFRFNGIIDGLHLDDQGNIRVQENKTGARIGDAWARTFATNHQVTGYLFAASILSGRTCRVGEAIGTQIPPPRERDKAGLVSERFERSDDQFLRWFEWLLTGVSMFNAYKDDPTKAPMFTHSCNRYNRSCSMIPFCAADEEQRLEMLEQMKNETLPSV